MSETLSGKLALVTGASAGIGRATVLALVEAGARVLATGRRKAELDALAKQCGGQAVEVVAGDLNDAAFVAELATRAADVDIMVSNAGILTYAPLMDMTFDETEAMFRINVLASFRVTHAVAKSMMARRRGHIIVMTSIAAREVYRLGVIYCATKHALSAIARGLRLELQEYGIKVTEIAPGMVDTDIRADGCWSPGCRYRPCRERSRSPSLHTPAARCADRARSPRARAWWRSRSRPAGRPRGRRSRS